MRIAAFLAATAVIGAWALPAGAVGAKPHRIKQKASVSAQINLRGTHGFQVDLLAIDPGGIILTASGRTSRVGMLNVNYSSFARDRRGEFEGGLVNVRIGRLGHFRGRFVPTRTETRNTTPECHGDPTTIEDGFFVGSFDFRGERGYTEVHSRRAPGSVTRQAAGTCTSTDERPWHESARGIRQRKEAERGELHLVAADERAQILFQARRQEATKDEPGQTTFETSVNGEKVGDFRVSYAADIFGFEDKTAPSFQVPNLAEPPAEATIAPPAPFSGAATFHLDDPQTASWTGDLAVDLPGLGKVPLTGSGIAAGLCKGPSHCTRTLPKYLQPILEAPANVIVAVSVPKPKQGR